MMLLWAVCRYPSIGILRLPVALQPVRTTRVVVANYDNMGGSRSTIWGICNNPESEYTLTMPTADIYHVVFDYMGTDIVLY